MNPANSKTYHSWEILTEDVAIKHCDRSVFQHHGSGIPIQSRWFWGVQLLKYSQNKHFTLKYLGIKYKAHIACNVNGYTRLFWHQDLSIRFNEIQSNKWGQFPDLRFERTGLNSFDVSFIFSHTIYTEINDNIESEIYDFEGVKEGKRLGTYTTKYERNPRNRINAIRIHGTKCMVCGFDFEEMYGAHGRNFIEVHHVKPLYDLEKEEIIDPRIDLVCLCSNCHRMIHRKRDAILSVEELKNIVQEKSL